MYPLLKFENQSTLIDLPKLKGFRKDLDNRIGEVERRIYKLAGRTFKINSAKEKSEVLLSLGITTNAYSKLGYLRTGKAQMTRLVQFYEDQGKVVPEIITLLIEYGPLLKADSSYITPFILYAENRDSRMRFGYKTQWVPTGRLAAGGEKSNTFFENVNIQAVTKSRERMWYCRPSTADNNILGWTFSEERESEEDLVTESYEQRGNLRSTFIADPGFKWVSIDFQAQELRIPANVTGEPVWVTAFNSGQDIHKATAVKIWGEENYDGGKRQRAKVANFGILYGMNAWSFMEKFKVSQDEAEKFVADFKASLPVLFAWDAQHKRRARKDGVVYNYFGRPRRVKHYFDSDDYKIRAFAYRTATNTVIQGAGADILKMALIRVYRDIINNPLYRGDVYFRSTIHDEINFIVRESRLEEITIALIKIMRMKIKGWPVTMEAEVSIGDSWGCPFKFNIDKEFNIKGPKASKEKIKEKEAKEDFDEDEEQEEEDFGELEITF